MAKWISAVIIAHGDWFELLKILLAVWSALSLISVVNFTIDRYNLITMSPPQAYMEEGISIRSFVYFLHPTLVAYLAYSLGSAGKPYSALFGVWLGIFISGLSYEILATALITILPAPLIFIIIPTGVVLAANHHKIKALLRARQTAKDT